MTPDGHPDLTGLWNGLADNLLGVPNQMHNVGIEVAAGLDARHSQRRAGPLGRCKTASGRIMNRTNAPPRCFAGWAGSDGPIYKPQYWQRVKDFDANSNEEDPPIIPCRRLRAWAFRCFTSPKPPSTSSSFIRARAAPIATATSYRMIPTDGRQRANLEDLDGTWNGESIGHWEGDTMVVNSIGFNSTSWFARRLFPQRKYARHRTFPSRWQHAYLDGDRGGSRRAARTLDNG